MSKKTTPLQRVRRLKEAIVDEARLFKSVVRLEKMKNEPAVRHRETPGGAVRKLLIPTAT